MDHAASLPYVLAKTNFRGKVYMTHPTKAIYKWVMQDSVRVQNTHVSSSSTSGTDGYVSQLFNEQDILGTLPMIQTVSFNTTHSHNGIRVTPYPAGHVLGACMYLIEIAGLNILFTGDYSREYDRHLIPATLPRNVRVDCLITESTFGISTHVPRLERETALMKSITGILNRGGRALLPVFAIGQAQNLLLILEDYWQRHPDIRHFPIYYASALARKCMVVYQTYIDAMNDSIRAKFQAGKAGDGGDGGGGPWDFQFIRSLKSLERFDDVGGCVMLASPGMLQNGVSRSLLERWAPDPKNGVLITGYSVEGTMAKQIMLEPDSIPAVMTAREPQGVMLGKRPGVEEKPMIPRRCTVQEISFAAHVDGQENREFIKEVDAPVVILVHGEKHNMNRLKSRLLGLQKFKVYSPVNCEEVRIPFRQDKVARVVGRLASAIQPPHLLPSPPASDEDGAEDFETKRKRDQTKVMSGVLVQKDFKLSLMAPQDLKEYAGLPTTTIVCRQRITLAAAGIDLIRWALEATFGTITVISSSQMNGLSNGDVKMEGDDADSDSAKGSILEVMGGAVRLAHSNGGEIELEWEGNTTNDSIADAVMAVLLTVESSPAAVKQSSKMNNHSHEHDHFGDSAADATFIPNGLDTIPRENPYCNLSPQQKLNRLFLFLEAQFGEDAITPIEQPKIAPHTDEVNGDVKDEDDVAPQAALATELARLHALGIPVPGLKVKVDKMIATVWLEKMEVEGGEGAAKSFLDRVKAVVDRAVDTIAPMWQ